MMRKQLDTNQGPVTIRWNEITGMGSLTPSASTAFTWGHCHSFAAAMNEKTNWPIYGIGGDQFTPSHFVLFDAALNEYIDIDGPGALDRWPWLVEVYKEPWDRKDLPPYNYRPLHVELAKPFVNSVLDRINTGYYKQHPTPLSLRAKAFREHPLTMIDPFARMRVI